MSHEGTPQADEKYLERKGLIKTPDVELIKQAKEKAGGYQDSNVNKVFEAIMGDKEFFREKRGTGVVYDIGAGKYGAINDTYFFELAGMDQVVLVEPVVERKLMKGDLDELEAEGKMKFTSEDGLSFLLDQENESGNVMVASIDISVIPVPDYHRRVAQEIYRVVPKDGYCVTLLSSEIEGELDQLFPLKKKFGSVIVYYKEVSSIEKEKQEARELAEKFDSQIKTLRNKLKQFMLDNPGKHRYERGHYDAILYRFKSFTGTWEVDDFPERIKTFGRDHAGEFLARENRLSDEELNMVLDDLEYQIHEGEWIEEELFLKPMLEEILAYSLEYIEKYRKNFKRNID